MVRVLHTSDTHLGHQQYPRGDPETGLNQREQDLYDTWNAVIDAAIADPPDLFLHSGDLFDGVRPSNRALAIAMEGFLRLGQAGIHTVLIAGNHEHPKTRQTGSAFRLFEHLPNVHAVYKGRLETFQLAGATVHAVPQCADADTFRTQVQAIERGPGPNILMLHGAVHTIDAFHHAEFNEQSIDPAWFDDRFDYVAIGHYHSTTEVTPHAWYCGAPDRVSIREAGEAKVILDVQVEHGDRPVVTPRALPVRTYIDLPALDAEQLDAAQILEAAQATLRRVPAGAIARLRILNVDDSLRGGLDQKAIKRAGDHALYLDLPIAWANLDHAVRGGIELGRLEDEFAGYALQQPLEGIDRDRLMQVATTLLREAQ